jgi:hypothetical protein
VSDWRTPHEKKAAKKASARVATAESSDWKRDRKAPKVKGNAHVSKAAWTKRKSS